MDLFENGSWERSRYVLRKEPSIIELDLGNLQSRGGYPNTNIPFTRDLRYYRYSAVILGMLWERRALTSRGYQPGPLNENKNTHASLI